MKVIDFLNKIANGEIPKKIRFKGREWDYDEEFNNGLYTDDMGTFSIYGNELLEEVEILEKEKKIPEKLTDILRVDDLIPPVNENMYKIWTQTIKNQNKINEIIDYLKRKGE